MDHSQHPDRDINISLLCIFSSFNANLHSAEKKEEEGIKYVHLQLKVVTFWRRVHFQSLTNALCVDEVKPTFDCSPSIGTFFNYRERKKVEANYLEEGEANQKVRECNIWSLNLSI